MTNKHCEDEYAKLWQMYGELENERDRLRDALRHYADQDNWNKNGICLIGPAIARTALQEAT